MCDKGLYELKYRFLALLIIFTMCVLSANGVYAADATTPQLSFKELSAAIAFSLAGAAAAIGMAQIGSTGISALAEKPELFSKVLMLLLFVEAIAIYGLVIAFLILLG